MYSHSHSIAMGHVLSHHEWESLGDNYYYSSSGSETRFQPFFVKIEADPRRQQGTRSAAVTCPVCAEKITLRVNQEEMLHLPRRAKGAEAIFQKIADRLLFRWLARTVIALAVLVMAGWLYHSTGMSIFVLIAALAGVKFLWFLLVFSVDRESAIALRAGSLDVLISPRELRRLYLEPPGWSNLVHVLRSIKLPASELERHVMTHGPTGETVVEGWESTTTTTISGANIRNRHVYLRKNIDDQFCQIGGSSHWTRPFWAPGIPSDMISGEDKDAEDRAISTPPEVIETPSEPIAEAIIAAALAFLVTLISAPIGWLWMSFRVEVMDAQLSTSGSWVSWAESFHISPILFSLAVSALVPIFLWLWASFASWNRPILASVLLALGAVFALWFWVEQTPFGSGGDMNTLSWSLFWGLAWPLGVLVFWRQFWAWFEFVN